MKEFGSQQIRNLGILGPRGAGKTTIVDAMSFFTGANSRQGRVDDGTSISDFTAREIERRTSLSAAVVSLQWRDMKLNILDLPGHPDFVGEVVCGLQVCGNAAIVLDAQHGVDADTVACFEMAETQKNPTLFFVNKMDKENTNWEDVLQGLKDQFGSHVVPVSIPMGSGPGLKGAIDLLSMKAISYDAGGKKSESAIPADFSATAEKWRQNLIEQVAETDEKLLEKFFAEGTLSDVEIQDGMRLGTLHRDLFPVMFGCAATGLGTQMLADFLVHDLPAPVDFPSLHLTKIGSNEVIEDKIDDKEKPVVYIFKTFSEGHAGDLYYLAVLTGSVSPGVDLTNHSRGGAERLGQLYALKGKERSDVTTLHAGDIGAVAKLKGSHTGDTLAPKDFAVTAPRPAYPEPVMDVTIRPVKKGEEEKMVEALHRIQEGDHSFKVLHDAALKQTVLFGQGSAQIDIIVDRLKRDFGVEVETDKPRVPFRESIRGKTEIQHKYKKQSGGKGQYGDVHILLEPLTRGSGFEFVNEITGGVIPSKFIPSVEKGIREAMEEGMLSGSPVVDVRVAVFYGSYHDVDSSDMAFKLAASMAFKEGFALCRPSLLEPIFTVEIKTPEQFTGDVMGDISSRRGKILGMEPNGRMQVIKAQIPQAELHNYSVDLRSMTQGQARYSRSFSHYAEAPHEVQERVKSEYAAARTAEHTH